MLHFLFYVLPLGSLNVLPLKIFTAAGQGVALIYNPMEVFTPLVFFAIATEIPALLPSPCFPELENQEDGVDKPYRPEKHCENVHVDTSYFFADLARSRNR